MRFVFLRLSLFEGVNHAYALTAIKNLLEFTPADRDVTLVSADLDLRALAQSVAVLIDPHDHGGFSAGVADTNGSGGILSEALKGKLGIGAASFLTAVVAIGITWAFDILQIIAIASKAFVFYYGLQSLQAMRLALKAKEWARALMFGFAVALALVIVLFAIPASA